MTDDYSGQQFFFDMASRLRDLEEKHSLLKDRILLIGETLIREREKSFSEIQEFKKELIILKEENAKMRDFIQKIAEHLSTTAKKSDFEILQRQLDIIRK